MLASILDFDFRPGDRVYSRSFLFTGVNAELARGGDETMLARKELLEEHDLAIDEQIALLRGQQEHIRDKIEFYRRAMIG